MIKDYSPREVVIDGTGLGVSLIDAMTIPTHDYTTSEVFPGYGLVNDEDYEGVYDRDAPKLIYRLVASSSLNTDIHSNFYTQIMGGHVRFLASEMVARSKLLATKKGQRMAPVDRAKVLLPYDNTSRLFDEIANLRVKAQASNTITLERISPRLQKDRVSALEYALWRIKAIEDEIFRAKKREKRNIGQYIQFTPKGKKNDSHRRRR